MYMRIALHLFLHDQSVNHLYYHYNIDIMLDIHNMVITIKYKTM